MDGYDEWKANLSINPIVEPRRSVIVMILIICFFYYWNEM